MKLDELDAQDKKIQKVFKRALKEASKHDGFWPNPGGYYDSHKITARGIEFRADYDDMGHQLTHEWFISKEDFEKLDLSM